MSHSRYIGDCPNTPKQSVIDEIDGLMDLVMVERSVKKIEDAIGDGILSPDIGIEALKTVKSKVTDGRLGKDAPEDIKKQFIENLVKKKEA